MYKIVLTIGHNVKDVPTWSTQDVASTAANVLEVSGLTAYECVGFWNGVNEKSTRIEIVCDKSHARNIQKRLHILANTLKQDAIMCEACEFSGSFVSA